jgi:hypothetical protein
MSQQLGLADPGLTAQDQDTAASGSGACHEIVESLAFVLPAEEPGP